MELPRVRFAVESNAVVELHHEWHPAETPIEVTKVTTTNDEVNHSHHNNEIKNIDLTSAEALAELELKIAALQTGKKSKIEAAMDNVELQETEEQVWVRRVHTSVSKLHFFDPNRRSLKARMTSFFFRWKMALPLEQKCTELARQMQERMIVLESIRESYVRDVVSVKHQLNNIYDVIDTHPKRAELASMPTVDLRNVIKNQLSNGASFQMQDMFVNSATIKFADTETMPWLNGRSFKEQKALETGYDYKLPSAPVGRLIDLYAPSRHKLLVKYCPHCIGVMALVHDWNEAVEDGLSRNVDAIRTKDLVVIINNLNEIIHKQGLEIEDLKISADINNSKQRWMNERVTVDSCKEEIHRLNEQLSKWKNIAGLADAERQTVEGNIRYSCSVQIQRIRREYDAMYDQCSEKTVECARMQAQFDTVTDEFTKSKEKVNSLEAQIVEHKNEIKMAELEKVHYEKVRKELIKGLDAKDRYVIDLKDEHTVRTDRYNAKISKLLLDIDAQKQDIDAKAASISKLTLEAMKMKEDFKLKMFAFEKTEERLKLENENLQMRLEDECAAHRRTYQNGGGPAAGALSTVFKPTEELSEDQLEGENDELKGEIRRSLMMFPTKLRLSMRSAIESVVSLKQSASLFRKASISQISLHGQTPLPSFLRGSSDADAGRSSHPHSDSDSSTNTPRSDVEDEARLKELQEAVRLKELQKEREQLAQIEKEILKRVEMGEVFSDHSNSIDEYAENVSIEIENNTSDQITAEQIAAEMIAEKKTAQQDDAVSFDAVSVEQPLVYTNSPRLVAINIPEVVNSSTPTPAEIKAARVKDLQDQREMLAQIVRGLHDMEETLIPALSIRNITLKTVAICVRFMVTMKTGLLTKDYSKLGSMGLRIVNTALTKELCQTQSKLQDAEFKLKEYPILIDQYESTQLSVHEMLKEAKNATHNMTREIDGYKNILNNVKSAQCVERMITNIQRSHAIELASCLSVIRARVHLLLHTTEIRDKLPQGFIPPPIKKPPSVIISQPPPVVATPVAKKKRITNNFGSSQNLIPPTLIAQITPYVQKEVEVLSDDEEANDRSQLAIYKTRKLFFHLLHRFLSLKGERPFRINSGIPTYQTGKTELRQWISSECQVVKAFVRDIMNEWTGVEQMVNNLRVQGGQERRRAEGILALLGVKIPLSVGLSFAGEPPAKSTESFIHQSSYSKTEGISSSDSQAQTDESVFIGHDKEELNLLATHRHDGNSLTPISSKNSNVQLQRKASVIGRGRKIREESNNGIVGSAQSAISVVKQDQKAAMSVEVFNPSLRLKQRRNAISGPAGADPFAAKLKEQTLKSEIIRLNAVISNLSSKCEKTENRVNELEGEVIKFLSDNTRLTSDLDIMIEDYQFLKRQNNTLKLAIHDSYRVSADATFDEIKRRGLEKVALQSIMQSKSTQVACVPCDLAVHLSHREAHVHISKGLDAIHAALDGDTQHSAITPFKSSAGHFIRDRGEIARLTVGVQATEESNIDRNSVADLRDSRGNFDKSAITHYRDGDYISSVKFQLSHVEARSDANDKPPLNNTELLDPRQESFLPDDRSLMAQVDDNSETKCDRMKRTRITSSDQYLQYNHPASCEPIVSVQRPSSSSTFSKIKNMPRSHRQLSQSISTPEINGHEPVDKPAIAQMAAALQVLHEARRNQLAVSAAAERSRDYEREKDVFGYVLTNARDGRNIAEIPNYSRTPSSIPVMNRGEIDAVEISVHGTPHHGDMLKQKGFLGGLTARPQSASAIVRLSPKYLSFKRENDSSSTSIDTTSELGITVNKLTPTYH